jgi:hypothetical protein
LFPWHLLEDIASRMIARGRLLRFEFQLVGILSASSAILRTSRS